MRIHAFSENSLSWSMPASQHQMTFAPARERHRPGCRLRVVEHNHVSGGETGR